MEVSDACKLMGLEDENAKLKKLQMRERGSRKRALGKRKPMVLPNRANERWSLDFMYDALTDGCQFRVLALVADTSLSGIHMTRELNTIIQQLGRPHTIVRGNETEITSITVLKW